MTPDMVIIIVSEVLKRTPTHHIYNVMIIKKATALPWAKSNYHHIDDGCFSSLKAMCYKSHGVTRSYIQYAIWHHICLAYLVNHGLRGFHIIYNTYRERPHVVTVTLIRRHQVHSTSCDRVVADLFRRHYNNVPR